MARLASFNSDTGWPMLYMEVQIIPSIEGLDVIYVQSISSWMDPILAYIRDGKLLPDPSEARKIKVRSSKFTILNDELYMRGVFPTLLEVSRFRVCHIRVTRDPWRSL